MGKKIMYNAGQPLWFWGADKNDTTHLRIVLEMDHAIDPEALLGAWKKTMKVYPLLDWVPEKVNGDLIFYEPESEPLVVEHDGPITPCSKKAGGRPIVVSFHEKEITLTFYHSIADAAGIIGVLRTFVYHYCCLHFQKDFDPAGIELREGRPVEDYYRSPFSLELGDYTPQPLASYPIGDTLFTDAEMAPPAPGTVCTSTVRISSEEFIRLCKQNDTSPSIMLCILLGKAIYSANPGDKRRMAFDITVNYRKQLGISDCLGVFSTVATVCSPYTEIMEKPVPETAGILKKQLDAQRTGDYAKTMMDMARTYLILKDALSGVISYEGRMDFGSVNDHVTNMFLVNNVFNTIHMIDFKGDLILHFQFGKATDKYREAFVKELEKAGVTIKEKTETYTVLNEV